MKNYFTISEFAKLRNININSLRYYEKIGILRPTHTDEKTGYRYYTADQLSALDTILLCIDLNIPLKELKNYIDEKGELHSRELFEAGKRVAELQIEKIQAGLNKIEYALQDLSVSSAYSEKAGVYNREVRSRRFRIKEYKESLSDIRTIEKEFTRLYEKAQSEGLSPIFPAELMLSYEKSGTRLFLLSEIVKAGDDIHENGKILKVPYGEFACIQAELRPLENLEDIIEKNFAGMSERTVIVTNLMLEKYNIANRKSEIQVTEKLFV